MFHYRVNICGLLYFHVLPSVTKDDAKTFLELVAFAKVVNLYNDKSR